MSDRVRWTLSGGLVLIAGVLTAVSAHRHWAACHPDAGTPTCGLLRARTYGVPLWGDVGQRDAFGTALAAVAAVLLGAAWLVVVGWARDNPGRMIMAVIIAVQPALAAVLVTGELLLPGRFFPVGAEGWLSWPAEILVIPLLLGAGWLTDDALVPTLRLLVLAWGVTSFGAVHGFVDHVVSQALSMSSLHSAPELGYVTAATQILLGLVVLVVSVLLGRRPEPEDGDEPGRDGFTLAA